MHDPVYRQIDFTYKYVMYVLNNMQIKQRVLLYFFPVMILSFRGIESRLLLADKNWGFIARGIIIQTSIAIIEIYYNPYNLLIFLNGIIHLLFWISPLLFLGVSTIKTRTWSCLANRSQASLHFCAVWSCSTLLADLL